jgi:hypothetical protein
LAKGIDGGGNPLNADDQQELMDYRTRLQVTLMALGVSSAELEEIIKSLDAGSNQSSGY